MRPPPRGVARRAGCASLLAGALLAACAPQPGATGPAPAPSDTVPPPTQTLPAPSPSETAPPSPAALATPDGAGPVDPEFEAQVDLPLQELEPGAYLVVWDLTALVEGGGAVYRYVTWEGDRSGALLELGTLGGGAQIPEWISLDPPEARFEVIDPPGSDALLFVDLNQGSLRQFAFGSGGCTAPNSSGYVGARAFGYQCDSPDGSRTWYAVDLGSLQILGGGSLPKSVALRGWLDPERAYFTSSFEGGSESFETCVARTPAWDLDCRSLPFWPGGLSPDGEWVWGWPPASMTGEDYVGVVPGVLEASCLEAGGGDCAPILSPPPPGLPPGFYPDLSTAAWTPDGAELIVIGADCVASETFVWRYAPDEAASSLLATLHGCYNLPAVGPVWSEDGSRFIVETGEAEDPPLVLSLTGESYPLPLSGSVVASYTAP